MEKKIVLYASDQVGNTLPEYVRYALEHLAETDFHVVLLTNQSSLSQDSLTFLDGHGIELFVTDKRGSYFGMWHRYLKTKVNSGFQSVERLLLANDSVAYYGNKFAEYFKRAEENPADAVSLLMSNKEPKHQLSFFLYLKQEAFGAFFLHIMESPERESHKKLMKYMEASLYNTFAEAEVTMDALYHTKNEWPLNFTELMQQDAGFEDFRLANKVLNFTEKFINQFSSSTCWKVVSVFAKLVDRIKKRTPPSP